MSAVRAALLRSRHLLPLLLAAACAPAKVADDTGDPGDTGADGGEADLAFTLTGDFAGSHLALLHLPAEDLGSGPWPDLEVFAATAVDGATARLSVDPPPAAHLAAVDPEDNPGLQLALYVPTLHLDEDGDGVPSGDEVLVGAGTDFAAWLAGPLGDDLAAQGFVEGWNGLRLPFGDDDAPPVHIDPLAIPLHAGLVPVETVTLAGTVEDPTGSELRLAVLPAGAFEGGGAPTDLLADEPLSDPWSLSLDAAPPDGHLQADDLLGQVAFEFPLAYGDADGSGGISGGDGPLYAACHGEAAVALVWVPPVSSVQAAFFLTLQGIGTGWSAFVDTGGDDAAFLAADERSDLVIGPDCAWD